MLVLIGQTTVALAAGWTYLMLGASIGSRAGGGLLALSIIPLPATILVLALFTALASPPSQRYYSSESRLRTMILRGGGITHDTLYTRILPFSLVLTLLVTLLAVVLPSAPLVVLGGAGILVGSTLVISLISRFSGQRQMARGAIRLRSSSPGGMSQESAVQELREKDVDDWVSSPGKSFSSL